MSHLCARHWLCVFAGVCRVLRSEHWPLLNTLIQKEVQLCWPVQACCCLLPAFLPGPLQPPVSCWKTAWSGFWCWCTVNKLHTWRYLVLTSLKITFSDEPSQQHLPVWWYAVFPSVIFFIKVVVFFLLYQYYIFKRSYRYWTKINTHRLHWSEGFA